MDWERQTEEIKNKYFRSGPYTHLAIEYCTTNKTLSWSFSCVDFGMCHEMSGHATVSGSECFSVDGGNDVSRENAWEAVFAGHYASYMRDFYREIGFETRVV
jgi:hypothetical protein